MPQQARFNPDVTDEKLTHVGASRKSPPSRAGVPERVLEISMEQLGVGFENLRIPR